MLGEGTVMATIAVSDLEKGKEFYQNTLGLAQRSENPAGVLFECGGGLLFIYQSTTAGKNQATSANWEVDDVEATVEELKSKGIAFEHYDMEGVTLDGDIHVIDQDGKAAWFKDPDGNILAVSSSM